MYVLPDPFAVYAAASKAEKSQLFLLAILTCTFFAMVSYLIIYWSKLQNVITSLTRGDSLRLKLIERNVTPYTKKLEEKISRNAKVEIK